MLSNSVLIVLIESPMKKLIIVVGECHSHVLLLVPSMPLGKHMVDQIPKLFLIYVGVCIVIRATKRSKRFISTQKNVLQFCKITYLSSSRALVSYMENVLFFWQGGTTVSSALLTNSYSQDLYL